jgi:urea transport system ATP-binding protein
VRAQDMARRGLSIVPQGRMIFPLLTVRENLETAFAVLPAADHQMPDEMFTLFPILKDFLHRRGGDLSGGQQQQLAIARALIMRPKVLLLDEPTEGIQPSIIQQIGQVLEYLKAKGDMAIILVEQYFEFAYGLADQVYVFPAGCGGRLGPRGRLRQGGSEGCGFGLKGRFLVRFSETGSEHSRHLIHHRLKPAAEVIDRAVPLTHFGGAQHGLVIRARLPLQ